MRRMLRASALVAVVLAAGTGCFGVKYNKIDTDSDGLMDFDDIDDDNDGVNDLVELVCGSDPKAADSKPTPPASADTSNEAEACRTALGGACNIGRPDGAREGQSCTVPDKTGNCAAGVWMCESSGLACRSINVSAEVCNGQDDNCDDQIDNLENRNCFTGLNGACAVGTFTCTNGQQGECQPATRPGTVAEVCNGTDDDCDGQVDEETDLFPNNVHPECQTGLSTEGCGVGTTQCTGGSMQCRAPRGEEICDGRDNDCDGQVDDNIAGVGQPCGNLQSTNICMRGVSICNGREITCQLNTAAQTDICGDGLDNDCNGRPDDAQACTCTDADHDGFGTGPGCEQGRIDCNDDNESIHPSAPDNTCDGVDQNCSGAADEGFVGDSCEPDPAVLGVCRTNARMQCQSGRAVCVPGMASAAESCNGVDDDCDGMTDEEVMFPNGPSCTVQGGASQMCSAGHRVCLQATEACVPNVTPDPVNVETQCNGVDDDCDNLVDEGFEFACGGGATLGAACSSTNPCAQGLTCAITDATTQVGVCLLRCSTVSDCNARVEKHFCLRFGSQQRSCVRPCDAKTGMGCDAAQHCTDAGLCIPNACPATMCTQTTTCRPQGFCLKP